MHTLSSLDRLLEKLRKLTNLKALAVVILFLLVVLFLNGISIIPNEHYQRLSQSPFRSRTDIAAQNYWQETVLLPLIAFYSQWNSRVTFNLLCFLIFLFSHLFFAQLTYKQFGSLPAILFSVILMTSPLTTVILTWLGTADSLTFGLTIPFLFINSSFLIFILAVLGTLNHIVFIIAAGEILLLRWIRKNTIGFSQLVSVLLGGVLGYGLVQLFLNLNHIQLSISRLDFTLERNLDVWVRMNASHFLAALFSLFNVHWLILILSLVLFFKMDKVYYSTLLVFLVLNRAITFFTEDTTRVFILLSWGILMECIFASYTLARKANQNGISLEKKYMLALVIIGMIAFISPRYFAWRGGIHPAPFYADIAQFFPGP